MIRVAAIIFVIITGWACTSGQGDSHTKAKTADMDKKKIHIYQVFTRLFGNTNTNNKPWGTKAENGVGKFDDFTDKALQEIKDLGITHIWYTGILHHALIADYTDYGISNDDPDVVKGRAGSPYAVKDYYQVNPDLATDPAKRLAEFEALIERTHQNDLKVIIDIVPNHVARKYEGLNNPDGVEDFGVNDDTRVVYSRDNNFYYIPDSSFKPPHFPEGLEPLGGEDHPMSDGIFEEVPAKWTGNGSRSAQPDINDWYETVKINYGVRPDGTLDFDTLPVGMAEQDWAAHLDFWKDKSVPDSWNKFKDITQFWLDKGVDGFRFDMAEMVPVEFWSYLNSHIKATNPDAVLVAEVYNPDLYRQYLHLGKMDYLYDKVELYDSLKHIIKGYGWTDHIHTVQSGLKDIEHHMLRFLENHDEQRIPSEDFARTAARAKPAMVVSATLSSSPTMIYFGQEVGEPAHEEPGFGDPTRTSIFDYVGVPHHQRWMNEGAFDGGALTDSERQLRAFYKRLLNVCLSAPALLGEYQETHFYNKANTDGYNHRVFSFARYSPEQKLIIITNFDEDVSYALDYKVPPEMIAAWGIEDGTYQLKDLLSGERMIPVEVRDGIGHVQLSLGGLESFILEWQ